VSGRPELGRVDPSTLANERATLHWAVQPIAAVADALLGAWDDHGQSNLGWDEGREALVSHDLGDGWRLALEPDALQLLLFGSDERVVWERTLVDATLDEVMASTIEALREVGLDASGATFDREASELPDHPVRDGGTFAPGDASARAEIAAWFAAARQALLDVTGGEAHTSEPRVWPHHFDLGQLVLLDPKLGSQRGRSIGLGLSPGDAYLAEPYAYVNPYPRPEGVELPDMDGGRWETSAFFGAVLPASEALESEGGAPFALVRFVSSAYSLCRALLREQV
jgi:hypothetical protein